MPKESYHKVILPIRSAIHAELVIKAQEERRSTTNLIQVILEQWVRELKYDKREGKDA